MPGFRFQPFQERQTLFRLQWPLARLWQLLRYRTNQFHSLSSDLIESCLPQIGRFHVRTKIGIHRSSKDGLSLSLFFSDTKTLSHFLTRTLILSITLSHSCNNSVSLSTNSKYFFRMKETFQISNV